MSFPSPRSSSLSVHLDLFICICSTWISPCLHLVSISVPERQPAGFMLCTYFSPSAHPTLRLCITSLSWPELDASRLSISSSSAWFYHTPSPFPSSLTAAKSTVLYPPPALHRTPRIRPLLLPDPPPWAEKRCSSANVHQDPSQGLNIQINFPSMPHSSLFFMVSLLFCMNNRCL